MVADRTIRQDNNISEQTLNYVKHFIRNSTDEYFEKLLNFWTASNQLSLQYIVDNNDQPFQDDGRLPGSSTCFNQLHITNYSTQDILNQRFIYAISESAGFGLAGGGLNVLRYRIQY